MQTKQLKSPREIIFEKAHLQGGKATTLEGALRYLRQRLPEPLPGLLRLTNSNVTPARSSEHYPSAEAYWTQKHAVRADAFARRHAQTLLGQRGSYTAVESLFSHLPRDVQARIAEQLDELWADHLCTLLEKNWPYRRARSTWAGGEHFIYISVSDEACAGGHTERVWSANGKWSGNDSYCTLHFTRRCINELGDCVVVGTLVTLDCERVNHRTYRATWAEQSRGVDLKMVDGWLVRGYHSTARTLQGALKKAQKARSQVASALAMRRATANGPGLNSLDVTSKDSINAGNCAAGTRNFIERHGLGALTRQAIRADALLALEDNSFTRAAIAFAARRHAKQLSSSGGGQ